MTSSTHEYIPHKRRRITKEKLIENWCKGDTWLERYFHPNETVWQGNMNYSYTWIAGADSFSVWYISHSLGKYDTIEEAKMACYEHAAQTYIDKF